MSHAKPQSHPSGSQCWKNCDRFDIEGCLPPQAQIFSVSRPKCHYFYLLRKLLKSFATTDSNKYYVLLVFVTLLFFFSFHDVHNRFTKRILSKSSGFSPHFDLQTKSICRNLMTKLLHLFKIPTSLGTFLCFSRAFNFGEVVFFLVCFSSPFFFVFLFMHIWLAHKIATK